MKTQVTITRQGTLTNQAEFSSHEEAQEWFKRHSDMGSFGKPEYTVEHILTPEHNIQSEVSPAEIAEDGSIVKEAVFEEVIVPAVIELEVIPAEFSVSFSELPEVSQEQINASAMVYLASTDWLVVRFMETGIAIPDAVVDQRRDARSKVVR